MKKHLQIITLASIFLASAGNWVQAQEQDTLTKVRASGTVAMGVRESSGVLSYHAEGDQYRGYHVDICQHIVASLEKALGRTVQVKYVPVSSQNRMALVQNGTVDLECGSTTNSAARQHDVAFAVTTYVEEVRLAVHANSGITSVKDLGGKTVATTRGSTSVQTLRKLARANGVGFDEVFGNDHADSFKLLESGRADAFLMDSQILATSIANAKTPSAFKIVGEALSVEPIAIMLRKNDMPLKKLADDTIQALQQSGELAKIHDKWFMQPIAPHQTRLGLPANEATKAAWTHLNDRPMEDYAKP